MLLRWAFIIAVVLAIFVVLRMHNRAKHRSEEVSLLQMISAAAITAAVVLIGAFAIQLLVVGLPSSG